VILLVLCAAVAAAATKSGANNRSHADADAIAETSTGNAAHIIVDASTNSPTGAPENTKIDVSTATDDRVLRIGLIAGDDPWSLALMAGAREAAAAIQEQGGVDGHTLSLVPLPTTNPWRDGAAPIAHLAAAPQTVALLSGSDGATAHLSAQVAARLRLPLLTASPETSLTQAGAVWVFRTVADDRQQAAALLKKVPGGPAGRQALLVVPGGREGRERQAALKAACRQSGVQIARVLTVQDTLPLPQAPATMSGDLLLLWLDTEAARDLILAWGGELQDAVILGSTRLSHAGFMDVMGEIDTNPAAVLLAGDSRDWAHRLGRDMVNLLATVMSNHGSSPAVLRAGLATMEPFAGETGMMTFDGHGNLRPEAFALPLPQRDEDTHE
jgi:hypothetical protein